MNSWMNERQSPVADVRLTCRDIRHCGPQWQALSRDVITTLSNQYRNGRTSLTTAKRRRLPRVRRARLFRKVVRTGGAGTIPDGLASRDVSALPLFLSLSLFGCSTRCRNQRGSHHCLGHGGSQTAATFFLPTPDCGWIERAFGP